MRALLPLALLALALAGCTAQPEAPRDGAPAAPEPRAPAPSPTVPPRDEPRPPAAPAADAPVWALGDAWRYALRTPAREALTELVVFRADDEHWWLGVGNRSEALEHALRDTNPLLGRIHYGILSPHERGVHAGMYSFPLEDGKAWSGTVFGRTWQFRAAWSAAEQRYLVQGAHPDGARIAFDLDPATRWFTTLSIEGPEGPELSLALQDARRGAAGSYVFMRGLDLYAGPGPQGPGGAALHVDEVAVGAEEALDAVGIGVRARASGPAAIAILDANNQEVWRAVLQPGEALDALVEAPATVGTWRVAYTNLANLEAQVRMAGLLVHEATV